MRRPLLPHPPLLPVRNGPESLPLSRCWSVGWYVHVPNVLHMMYTDQLNSLHREYRDSGTSSCIAQVQVNFNKGKLIDEIGRLLSCVHLLRMLSDEAWEGVSFPLVICLFIYPVCV